MKEQFFKWLNTFLMLDLFLVLLSFVWLAAAVIGRTANFPLGLDLWYKLWDPLFTPALGILMMGAIVSGIANWITKRLNLEP